MEKSQRSKPKSAPTCARRWRLGGRVQGVGFRPHVYRLAERFGLRGWVRNLGGQVDIHAEGPIAALDLFAAALLAEAPPLARTEILHCQPADMLDAGEFRILDSNADSGRDVHVAPDYYACDDCLRELADPHDRRHAYPFINCTQCGPRYTLITALPYDRANTTLAGFPMCAACAREYRDPLNRRFHAEPVACPACGPQLQYYSDDAGSIDDTATALATAIAALRAGFIVAVKGVGGYHLMCDAANDRAVRRLRLCKRRPDKPLAVMCPRRGDDGLEAVRAIAVPTDTEATRLLDPERPIVLLTRRRDTDLGVAISAAVAPDLDELGVMLPYSPLHQLLLEGCDRPLVATSANVSGEPVLTDNVEVEQRLTSVADAFLHHDRPIVRPADDPVARVIARRARPLRLGRGNAPLELDLPRAVARPLLAVGGHTKNTVALAWDRRLVVSPHIGDLGSLHSQAVFVQVIADLQALYGVTPELIACDAHPDYASTRWAERQSLTVLPVFHHHAHASALAGEYPQVERWLMFTWDGVGYGPDGTLWGGEALLGNPGQWQRVARMRPFRLSGGDRAGREPWRSAAALCWEQGLDWPGPVANLALAHQAWQRGLNCATTTAVGRLFDAAAALTRLAIHASYEGHGPMQLEAVSAGSGQAIDLPLTRGADGLWQTDWAPLVPHLLDRSIDVAQRGADFHASLAQALHTQARAVRAETGINDVGLTGGVFQNRRLTELSVALLEADGFAVHLAQRLPCNDGGLSFGQVIEALGQTLA